MKTVPSENILKLRELNQKLTSEAEHPDEYKKIVNELKEIVECGKQEIIDTTTSTSKIKCYENMCSKITMAVETVYSEPPEDSGAIEVDAEVNDELQPGGLASGSPASNTKKVEVFSDSALESPLSSMSIKELRRMAEANNIPGSAELRKKDLIKALRDKVGQLIGNEQPQNEKVLSFDDIGAPGSE